MRGLFGPLFLSANDINVELCLLEGGLSEKFLWKADASERDSAFFFFFLLFCPGKELDVKVAWLKRVALKSTVQCPYRLMML